MNSFFARRYIITGIFIAISFVLLARLFYLQIIDKDYLLMAKANVVRSKIVFPARGPILDRNGKVLVENQPLYDIMVTPKQVKNIDTAAFCAMIGIDKDGFEKRMQKAIKASGYNHASVFEGQLSQALYASLQERLYEFPGFDIQLRSVRAYPDSIAAHFLGYIGEVSDAALKKLGGYYHPGDYIGITGVEAKYEDVLRGQRGIQNLMVDSHGIPKGRFANGDFDTSAVAGERLLSSLDSRIQKLGEQLMAHKVGSIVAIEPSSGEILAFVSSPGYNPNNMVGRNHGNVYMDLLNNPYKPLLIRPIQATYRPGSSFKPLDALIAIQEGLITPQTTYNCPGYYIAGNRRIKCFHGEVHGNVNLASAIAESCNGYFDMVFEKLINQQGVKKIDTSFNYWHNSIARFGLGSKLNVDLPGERPGFLPQAKFYDAIYHKGGWRSSTVISLGIGQGEMDATPLQLANLEAIIANRGYYYRPHLIKGVGDKNIIKKEYTERNYVGIDTAYFEPVIDGMQRVVSGGTASASNIPGIIMCGKTGTAQNQGAKDNSVFVAFAPRDNPKIAIAVVVENAGQGAEWAAPIASFMVEKYLRDSISRRPSGIDPVRYMNAVIMPELKQKPAAPVQPKDTIKKHPDKPAVPKPIKALSTRNKGAHTYYAAGAMLKRKEDGNE